MHRESVFIPTDVEFEEAVWGDYCEYPPRPPIGKLRLKFLGTPEEYPALVQLLHQRFGFQVSDVMQNPDLKPRQSWNSTKRLALAILSLEGKTAREIKETFPAAVTPQKPLSSSLINQSQTTLLTAEALLLASNAKRLRKAHGVLFPERSETERMIQEIENALDMPRASIWNITKGALPSAFDEARDTYDVHIATSIVHRRVVQNCRIEDNCSEAEKSLPANYRRPITMYDIRVLCARLLSDKAREKLRILEKKRRDTASPALSLGASVTAKTV